MKSTNMRRFAAIAAIAVAVPMGFASTASAGRNDHQAEGSFRFPATGNDAEDQRVSFDVAGDDDDGDGWWTYRKDDDVAYGRILCVGGSDLNKRKQGETAAIGIQIRKSSFDGGPFAKGEYVLHYVQDHPGPDRHRLLTGGDAGDADCPRDDFRMPLPGGMDLIGRGDIDVDVDND